MTEDDILSEQPEHRVATNMHAIHSALFDLAEMVAHGEGKLVRDELPELDAARIQIDNLLTYLQLHRAA